ncbi:DUF2946 family protein [Sphingomonas sp. M1A8_2b]
MLFRQANTCAFRFAMLIAALFAILVQGLVVQAHTHVHRNMAPIVHAAGAQAFTGAADDGSTQQDETDCPLCWELAHADAFLLPEDPVFLPPATSKIWLAALLQSVSVRNVRSHAWRSRAPPLPLQA